MKKWPGKTLFFLAGMLMLASCREEPWSEPLDETIVLEVPAHFPQPEMPLDNPLTQARIALGKKLFYDPILSRDSSISCGSCHKQEHAFTDPKAISPGVEERLGFRNASTLTNLVYHRLLNKDGGVPSLEKQMLVPLGDHAEMDFNMAGLIDRLQKHPDYPLLFQAAYGRIEVDAFGVSRAIAAFERTLISGNSRYDQSLYGKVQLSDAEERGRQLFFSSPYNCSQCHSGFNFTTDDFQNNGLYAQYSDTGRARVTLLPGDRGKFKVPTLRNVEVTGPYMHDGSLNGLDEVIDHYASGGSGHPNQSPLVAGFSITAQERADLIAFLRSLTDTEFLTNPRFADEPDR